METIKNVGRLEISPQIRMSIFAIVIFLIKLYNFYVSVIVIYYQNCKYKEKNWHQNGSMNKIKMIC